MKVDKKPHNNNMMGMGNFSKMKWNILIPRTLDHSHKNH